MPEHYISYRVVEILLQNYVSAFLSTYSREGKFISTRFDPKVVGMIIKALTLMLTDVTITKEKL